MLRSLLAVLALCVVCQAEGVWVEQRNPFTDSLPVEYSDVCFLDSLVGYVYGAYGNVLKTRDGGKTWEVQDVPSCPPRPTPGSLNGGRGGIAFTDSAHGWVVAGNEVHSTGDGGTTWKRHVMTLPVDLQDVEFKGLAQGWMVGRLGYPPRSIILHTGDGGETWQVQDSLGYSGSLRGVCFLDTLKGIAVGDLGLILQTLDGGQHWEQLASGTQGNLLDVQFANSAFGMIVGDVCLKTSDGGAHWTMLDSWSSVGRAYDVAIPDTAHIWVTGVHFSGDQGTSWKYQELPAMAGTFGISFPDTAHGWVAGEHGKIFRYYTSLGVDEGGSGSIPDALRLNAYPNPSRQHLVVRYSLPERAWAHLGIHDAAGREVTVLRNGGVTAGTHEVVWNRQELAAGVYFLGLGVNGIRRVTRKVVVLD